MLVNLVNKYGLVPKVYYPETHTSESSRYLNKILSNKVEILPHILIYVLYPCTCAYYIILMMYKYTKKITLKNNSVNVHVHVIRGR